MIEMRNRIVLMLTFIVLLMNLATQAEEQPKPSATNELPAYLLGIWQVTEVHVDTGATRTLLYHDNDFRLKGRLFTIEHNKMISNTPENQSCTNPRISTSNITAVNLIAHSMAGRGLPPETPTPIDYELPVDNNTAIAVLSINCQEGLWASDLGRDGGIQGAWMFIFNNDNLAIRWYDETILILKKLPANAKPKASFNCEKAATLVEKTICGSMALASFDSSVSQSYVFASKQYQALSNLKAISQLRTQQKQWLVKRDSCGNNFDCLQKSMAERLEVIENELNTLEN